MFINNTRTQTHLNTSPLARALFFQNCIPRLFSPPAESAATASPNALPVEASPHDYFFNLAHELPEWLSPDVKKLFESTAFVDSVEALQEALRDDTPHIVWRASSSILLCWEKENKECWTLKILHQPAEVASKDLKASVFSPQDILLNTAWDGNWIKFFAIGHSWAGSFGRTAEWTDSLKTRIDPLTLHYRNIPKSAFSQEWLEALQGQKDPSVLFAPLKPFRTEPAPLPKAKDKEGYLQRFMTRSRGMQQGFWLYKAWMRSLLPRASYKEFHLFNRYQILKDYDRALSENAPYQEAFACAEAASKLLRSAEKHKVNPLSAEQSRSLQEIVARRQPKSDAQPPLARLASFLCSLLSWTKMPPSTIREKSTEAAAVHATHRSQEREEYERCYEYIPIKKRSPNWKSDAMYRKYPFSSSAADSLSLATEPIDLNSHATSLLLADNKQEALIKIVHTYNLGEAFKPSVQASEGHRVYTYAKLLCFKRLFALIHPELTKRLSFVPNQDIGRVQHWQDPALYKKWQEIYNQLLPEAKEGMILFDSLYDKCFADANWYYVPSDEKTKRSAPFYWNSITTKAGLNQETVAFLIRSLEGDPLKPLPEGYYDAFARFLATLQHEKTRSYDEFKSRHYSEINIPIPNWTRSWKPQNIIKSLTDAYDRYRQTLPYGPLTYKEWCTQDTLQKTIQQLEELQPHIEKFHAFLQACPHTCAWLEALFPFITKSYTDEGQLVQFNALGKESHYTPDETTNPFIFGPAFNPHSTLDVAAKAVPHIGPLHAFVSYAALSDEQKFSMTSTYSKEVTTRLDTVLFQECFAQKGMSVDTLDKKKEVLAQHANGYLPLKTLLEDPKGRLIVEDFFQSEYKKLLDHSENYTLWSLFHPLRILLRLGAQCAHFCPTLILPDFTPLFERGFADFVRETKIKAAIANLVCTANRSYFVLRNQQLVPVSIFEDTLMSLDPKEPIWKRQGFAHVTRMQNRDDLELKAYAVKTNNPHFIFSEEEKALYTCAAPSGKTKQENTNYFEDIQENLKTLHLYMFWIYSEQKNLEKAAAFRPLDDTFPHSLALFAQQDQDKILIHLRALPTALSSEEVEDPFDWKCIVTSQKQTRPVQHATPPSQVVTSTTPEEERAHLDAMIGVQRSEDIRRFLGADASQTFARHMANKNATELLSFLTGLGPAAVEILLEQLGPTGREHLLAVIPLTSQNPLMNIGRSFLKFCVSDMAAESGYSSQEGEIIEGQMTYNLGLKWSEGEEIVVQQPVSLDDKYNKHLWKLRDRPQLYWRPASEEGALHTHELVDAGTGGVTDHVFTCLIPKFGENTSQKKEILAEEAADLFQKTPLETFCFAIPCKANEPNKIKRYHPKSLDEQLCLLAVHAGNIPAQWEILQSLPKITHDLSPKDFALMLRIISSLLIDKNTLSFDHLGLSMQILERFCSWIENPTLKLNEKDPVVTTCMLALKLTCVAGWELYRDLQHNIDQRYVLNSLQRKKISALLQTTLQEKLSKKVDEFELKTIPLIGKRLDAYAKTVLCNASVTQQKRAWWRRTKIKHVETSATFAAEEAESKNVLFPFPAENKNMAPSFYARVGCVFLRFLGIRHLFSSRITRLEEQAASLDSLIPSGPLTKGEMAHHRMKIAAEKKNHNAYCCEIADWALGQGLRRGAHEMVGTYIARAEVRKHVYNALYNIINITSLTLLPRLWRGLRALPNICRLFPSKVAVQADRKRDPFELYIEKTTAPIASAHTVDVVPMQADILIMANKLGDVTSVEGCAAAARRAAKLERPVIWADLVGLFGKGQMRHLREINPNLTDDACDRLDALVQAALIAIPHTGHRHYDPTQTDLTKRYAVSTQINGKAEIIHIDGSVTRAKLLFEVMTNMRLRKNQDEKCNLLFYRDEKGDYPNLAMQQEMGGGKTDVLASIALYLGGGKLFTNETCKHWKALKEEQPARISVFIPPAAQYETLAVMLTKTQKERFNQEVIPINMPFTLMTDQDEGETRILSALGWFQDCLSLAKTKGHALLIHPSTFHHLKLALRSTTNPKILKALFEIRDTFKKYSNAILDELDMATDPLKDTSMAQGERHHPKMDDLEMFKNLILRHREDPSLWEALCKNTPEKINLAHYKEFQIKVLAPWIAEKQRISEALKSDFCRYITGNLPQDKDFLSKLGQQNFDSLNRIALYKHWMEDILPFTIFRERGRHFGRAPHSPKVVPYVGVGSPGKTEFAQLGEKIVYYFLTSLSSPMEKTHFAEVVEICKKRYEALKKLPGTNQIKIQKFDAHIRTIMGCSIDEICNTHDKIDQALATINNDLTREMRLSCECYLAQAHIEFYPTQYTSTSQDLFEMFRSHRGFSGTFPGHVNAFDHRVVGDPDSDASVIKAMKTHSEKVITTQNISPEFWQKLSATSNMGGLIDSGGLCRDYTNEHVAQQVLQHFSAEKIQSVLFFGKQLPTDLSPDTPMLLQRGPGRGFVTRVLGSTKPDMLKAWGVDLNTLFVYYDQRHCEATDVLQCDNRCNAVTIGLRSTSRDLLQAIMRMRKYKTSGTEGVHQTALFVMLQDTKIRLFGRETIVTESLIRNRLEQIQKEETAKRCYRTYIDRVNAALCSTAEDYIEAHHTSWWRRGKVAKLRAFFLRLLVDASPFRQFGGIAREVPTKENLLKYLASRRAQFEAIYGTLPAALIANLEKTATSIRESTHLAAITSVRESGHCGQEQEQEQEQAVQQEVQQEVEQQTTPVPSTPGGGAIWKEQKDYKIIDLSKHYSNNLALVKKVFKKSLDSQIFAGLYASENFLHTYTETYKLNHPDQKRADYLLVERIKGKTRILVLTAYDVQNYSTGTTPLPANSCIITAIPSEITKEPMQIKGELDFTHDEKLQVQKAFLQAAYLNGNLTYIATQHTELAQRASPIPLTQAHCQWLRKRVHCWQSDLNRSGGIRTNKNLENPENPNLTMPPQNLQEKIKEAAKNKIISSVDRSLDRITHFFKNLFKNNSPSDHGNDCVRAAALQQIAALENDLNEREREKRAQ